MWISDEPKEDTKRRLREKTIEYLQRAEYLKEVLEIERVRPKDIGQRIDCVIDVNDPGSTHESDADQLPAPSQHLPLAATKKTLPNSPEEISHLKARLLEMQFAASEAQRVAFLNEQKAKKFEKQLEETLQKYEQLQKKLEDANNKIQVLETKLSEKPDWHTKKNNPVLASYINVHNSSWNETDRYY